MIGMSEISGGLELMGDGFMADKFKAVIKGNRLDWQATARAAPFGAVLW